MNPDRRIAFAVDSTVLCPPLPSSFQERLGDPSLTLIQNTYTYDPLRQGEIPMLDTTGDIQSFCQSLTQGDKYQTAIAGPGVYKTTYEKLAKGPTDILVFCSDSQRTGGLNSAQQAANLLDKNLGIRIFPFDTGLVAAGGVFLPQAVELAKLGLPAEQIVAKLEEQKRLTRLLFATDNLQYLQNMAAKRGMALASLGLLLLQKLHVHPLLEYKEGSLHIAGRTNKIVDREQAVTALNQIMVDTAGGGIKRAAVLYSYPEKRALALKDMLTSQMTDQTPPPVLNLGRIVTTYVGPNTWGVVYMK